ncbi:hypothetical protein CN576_21830 [Bacillus wiedmannii]|nr:hypothetical protein CN576_21830 [Bacillus wiedmannii]
MTKTITVITGRTVITKSVDRWITVKSSSFGDCVVCWERMDLKKNCTTGEEILVCSNKQVCNHREKMKHIKFFK